MESWADMVASRWEKHNLVFSAAGVAASGTALFNLVAIEKTFSDQLPFFATTIKFLHVKVLVSFAFLQSGIFYTLQGVYQSLPVNVRSFAKYKFLIWTIMKSSQVQLQLIFASMIIYESLIVACLQCWVWQAREEWYQEIARGTNQEETQSDRCVHC